MKRLLYIFALFFCHVAFAELEVEWIDENTIRVYGTGYGGGDYTNALGSCTNCLAISPDEMHDIKVDVLQQVDESIIYNNNIAFYASSISNLCESHLADIATFRRFSNIPSVSSASSSVYASFTNYVFTVNNNQTRLDISHKPASLTSSAPRYQWISYNNGIYDYANDVVKPTILAGDLAYASEILSNSEQVSNRLSVIRATVDSITEDACQSCGSGGDTNSTSSSSCPCKEQFDALVEYVRHIDEDQHRRFFQLSSISNNLSNIDNAFDSYARLVSGVLYNDATIVVDDGENSWSNVYRRGYSDLYDYDKSNILQRIELLLFGVSYNTSTNWGDSVESVEDTSDEIEEKFADAEDTLREQSESLKDDVELIKEKFTTFVNRLNFFGAGHLGEFSVIDPITVFDAYTFDVDSGGFASDLGNLQQVSRTCFQIFYWVSSVLFMIWFWWSFIRFVINHVFTLVKFFNNLLT